MIFKTLKEILHPSPPITVFELHKTTPKFVHQVAQLFVDLFSDNSIYESMSYPNDICKAYYFSRGEKPLDPGYGYNLKGMMEIMTALQDDDFLDFVNFGIQLLSLSNNWKYLPRYLEFQSDLNDVFRQNGIGYEVGESTLIPIIDETTHDHLVMPTLEIIRDNKYSLVNKEMMLAFENYKSGNYRACIHNSCNAVECLIKQIMSDRVENNIDQLTLTKLTEQLKSSGFFHNYDYEIQKKLVELMNALGVVRNNCGGHGPNPGDAPVSEDLARYALFMSLSNVNYLISISKNNARL